MEKRSLGVLISLTPHRDAVGWNRCAPKHTHSSLGPCSMDLLFFHLISKLLAFLASSFWIIFWMNSLGIHGAWLNLEGMNFQSEIGIKIIEEYRRNNSPLLDDWPGFSNYHCTLQRRLRVWGSTEAFLEFNRWVCQCVCISDLDPWTFAQKSARICGRPQDSFPMSVGPEHMDVVPHFGFVQLLNNLFFLFFLGGSEMLSR